MSSRFDLIAQQLFRKDFDHCTLDELLQFAAAHPYLAPAHYLVVRKMADVQDSRYSETAQTAALYYHQPVAFEVFLHAPEPLPILDAPEPAFTEAPELPQIATVVTEPVVIAVPEVMEGTPITQEEEVSLPALPPLPKLDAPVASDALTFEPFHTVDYFASMGIRLSQDEVPKDKFGKQLMSFTAWLKTMKKLPASEHARNMDPQAEARVESMAAHSVSSPEVVTETMAEIWIKQGQPAKAADVYRKLSLLHPSKKAYFASKLENLKQ